jgi:uncharacterized Fe-S cluster-containing protein
MPGDLSLPGRDCGACGFSRCSAFAEAVRAGARDAADCPFLNGLPGDRRVIAAGKEFCDILGTPFDFILEPLPGEVSARKMVLPFRPDQVEKMDIRPGDIVVGRPMGAGCPVQHVLRVITASQVSGLLTCHVVGPAFSRNNTIKDVEAYHMIGFEGLARVVGSEPVIGRRMRFLPGFCMMNLAHTGVVNMLLATSAGLRIRIEDVRL